MMDVRVARMMTFVLAGICGLLLLTALIQLAGYGRGYGWLPPETDTAALDVGSIDRNPFRIPAFSTFSEVERRPLFNEDRKPTPVSEGEVAEEGPPPTPLNVTLTGVILVRKSETTPELRIAMVRDNLRNESVALKVGMPLSGDQAGWTLVALEPRKATFKNANDESKEIELQPAAGAPQAPAVQRPAQVAPAKPGAVAPANAENAQESDLAKRIEERRRQMREEAERLRSQRSNSSNERKN